jgi:hypothetical protein
MVRGKAYAQIYLFSNFSASSVAVLNLAVAGGITGSDDPSWGVRCLLPSVVPPKPVGWHLKLGKNGRNNFRSENFAEVA